jgi:hypothetical protein
MDSIITAIHTQTLANILAAIALLGSLYSVWLARLAISRTDRAISLQQADSAIPLFTKLQEDWEGWQLKLTTFKAEHEAMPEDQQINHLKQIVDTTMLYSFILLRDNSSFPEPIATEMSVLLEQVTGIMWDDAQDPSHRILIFSNVAQFLEGPYINFIRDRLAKHRRAIIT